MLASYAVVLRRSAVITAPAAVVMIVLSAVLGGGKALLGSVLAVGLVAAFYGISAFIVTYVGRIKPSAAMAAAGASYAVKVLVLLVLVARYSDTTAFNGKVFGLTAIGCILIWSGAQAVISMRLKVPYVEPDPKLTVPHAEPDGKLTVSSAEPDGKR
jgi:ATP synthase protein I